MVLFFRAQVRREFEATFARVLGDGDLRGGPPANRGEARAAAARSGQQVTLAQFLEYYANWSAVVDNDNYFSVMLWECWDLGAKPVHAQQWAAGKTYGERMHARAGRDAHGP